ncbi:hypothetical protein MHBO_005304 [Bonamia ostreae]|uniref:Uncharacterized protein n=1 Tax=Bonamia ostreae TaxID=126728 RepID=A0ABV2AE66_9EUKA
MDENHLKFDEISKIFSLFFNIKDQMIYNKKKTSKADSIPTHLRRNLPDSELQISLNHFEHIDLLQTESCFGHPGNFQYEMRCSIKELEKRALKLAVKWTTTHPKN